MCKMRLSEFSNGLQIVQSNKVLLLPMNQIKNQKSLPIYLLNIFNISINTKDIDTMYGNVIIMI